MANIRNICSASLAFSRQHDRGTILGAAVALRSFRAVVVKVFFNSLRTMQPNLKLFTSVSLRGLWVGGV